MDWDKTLLSVITRVRGTEKNDDFNRVMEELIDEASGAQFSSPSGRGMRKSAIPRTDWQWQADGIFSDGVSDRLINLRLNHVPADNPYYRMSQNQAPNYEVDNRYAGTDSDLTEEIRLLALFRYWNIVQYFFPYRDLMDQDWDTTLKEFIPRMISRDDDASYYYTLFELRSRLNGKEYQPVFDPGIRENGEPDDRESNRSKNGSGSPFDSL